MRLACYGWVDAEAGSVASANFIVLRELLSRGVEIDFFANADHVPRPRGLEEPGFRYIGIPTIPAYRHLSAKVQSVTNWVLEPIVRAAWRRTFDAAIQERIHSNGMYDAVLSLGTPSPFSSGASPTISWLQGPPTGELDAIRRLKNEIVTNEGHLFWVSLVTLYRYRMLVSRGAFTSSDRLICGSEWSRQTMIAAGFAADRVAVLPYPTDLEVFRPATSSRTDRDGPVLLSLGRLDPRKRLDLLVRSFEILLERRPTARLTIVGRRGYAPNSLQPMLRSPARHRIEYHPWVPREQLSNVLATSSVLVQTSENENFGSSVAEALACGVPVVVGPRNGTAEYIDANSRVFEAYTPQSVASAVDSLLETQTVQPELVASACRETAERNFAASAIVDNLLEILSRASGSNAPIGARSGGLARATVA